MQLTEEMVSGSSASRTSALITSLVQYIISSWRNHFARSTAMKFNCFFLMPFMADFPDYLRTELDKVYEGGVGELFDIAETRRSLLAKRDEMLAECEANSKLQRRFDQIAAQLRSSGGNVNENDMSVDTSDFTHEAMVDDDLDMLHEASSSSSTSFMGPTFAQQEREFLLQQDNILSSKGKRPHPSQSLLDDDELYQSSSDNNSGKRPPSNKFSSASSNEDNL